MPIASCLLSGENARPLTDCHAEPRFCGQTRIPRLPTRQMARAACPIETPLNHFFTAGRRFTTKPRHASRVFLHFTHGTLRAPERTFRATASKPAERKRTELASSGPPKAPMPEATSERGPNMANKKSHDELAVG